MKIKLKSESRRWPIRTLYLTHLTENLDSRNLAVGRDEFDGTCVSVHAVRTPMVALVHFSSQRYTHFVGYAEWIQ